MQTAKTWVYSRNGKLREEKKKSRVPERKIKEIGKKPKPAPRHVLTLHGICMVEAGYPMVVLPYMANGDLRSFVRDQKRKLPLPAGAISD